MQAIKTIKNGNSPVMHTPVKLAYARADIDLEINQVSGELRIRSRVCPLTGVLTTFAKFEQTFMESGRGNHQQKKRELL